MAKPNVDDFLDMPLEKLDENHKFKSRKLDYYNQTIYGMSYSRSTLMHGCPKRFELSAKYKLRTNRANTDFAYGHAVGAGIQAVLAGESRDRAILKAIIEYDYPLEQCEEPKTVKDGKTVWNAILMVEKFHGLYTGGVMEYFDGWEVAQFDTPEGKVSGVELTFVIKLPTPEGQPQRSYEGHIDLVLYHPAKNRYMVLELKTSKSRRIAPESYCNSAQALGYGVVLDNIAHNFEATSSFDVLYLVAQSVEGAFVPMPFTKTYKDKAEFLMGMIDDMELVERYEEMEFWPRRGENCYNFFRPCEYISVCHLSDDELRAREVSNSMDSVLYSKLDNPTFMFTLDELLSTQQQLQKFVASHAGGEVDMLLNVQTLL